MPLETSYQAGPPRSRRTALGQLLAMWRALPRSARRFAADFAAVLADEGREVPQRLAWMAIPAALGVVLIIAAWLLLCVATAWWLAATYGWRGEMALYLVAAVNVLLALIAMMAAYRALKSPLFPFTTYEWHRLRSNGEKYSEQSVVNAPPLAHAGPKARALMRSEAELKARLAQVKQATPGLLTTPSVLAATVAAGLILGFTTAKRRPRSAVVAVPAGISLARQLLNVAVVQLSSLAAAAALRELQRRARHERGFY